MRGIKYPADLRDNLLDDEIVPRLLHEELVADPSPVVAVPPPSPPHA